MSRKPAKPAASAKPESGSHQPRPLVRLVDDDTDLLAAQIQSLRIAGFQAEAFASASEALSGLGPDYPGVILSDIRMPGMDGFEFFRRLQQIDPELPVILLTGHGDVPMAVAAIREGVWDFLTKPLGLDELAAALRRAAQARALVMENRQLRAMRSMASEVEELLGSNPAITALRETALRLAEAGVDILVTGPSGAGKEALARLIHRRGPRRARAFVHVACDTLDEARFDLDFLGAEAGHAAAARHTRIVGRMEKAHRGTLFLDRIDMLTPALQARFLNLIEMREFWALGAAAARPLDMHVIAATQADLAKLAGQGRFLPDLYYRLSGVTLAVPPLRQRPADVPILFRHFLLAACNRLNLPVPALTPQVQARLESHDWPGNVRELMQFAEAQALGIAPLAAPGIAIADGRESSLADKMAAYEAGLLREALAANAGNVTRAMASLDLARKTFYDKLHRHNIRPEAFRDRTGRT